MVLGGHLHVVLNPPQSLTDPSGRKVLLAHSGAFAKYVGRLDLVVQDAGRGAQRLDGAEVVSHDYRVFPLDACGATTPCALYYKSNFWNPGEFINTPRRARGHRARASSQEDRETTDLLADATCWAWTSSCS